MKTKTHACAVTDSHAKLQPNCADHPVGGVSLCPTSAPAPHSPDVRAFAVWATIGDSAGHVLLDTGADCCFISKRKQQDLCLPVLHSVRKVATAAGHSATSIGYVNTTVYIHDHELPIKAWVIDLPPQYDIIIGCDILCQHRVRLDVGSRTIEFLAPRVPFGEPLPMADKLDQSPLGSSEQLGQAVPDGSNIRPDCAQQGQTVNRLVSLASALSYAIQLTANSKLPAAVCAAAHIVW